VKNPLSKCRCKLGILLMHLSYVFVQDTLFDPVALGCGHLFCNSCACSAASVAPFLGPKAAKKSAQCPLCRQVTIYNWPSFLDNWVVKYICRCPLAQLIPFVFVERYLRFRALQDGRESYDYIQLFVLIISLKMALNVENWITRCVKGWTALVFFNHICKVYWWVQAGVYVDAVRLNELAILLHNR
jgi:hypothetical protein